MTDRETDTKTTPTRTDAPIPDQTHPSKVESESARTGAQKLPRIGAILAGIGMTVGALGDAFEVVAFGGGPPQTYPMLAYLGGWLALCFGIIIVIVAIVSWGKGMYLAALFSGGYGLLAGLEISEPGRAGGAWATPNAGEIAPLIDPGAGLVLSLISAFGLCAAGIVGIVRARSHENRSLSQQKK